MTVDKEEFRRQLESILVELQTLRDEIRRRHQPTAEIEASLVSRECLGRDRISTLEEL